MIRVDNKFNVGDKVYYINRYMFTFPSVCGICKKKYPEEDVYYVYNEKYKVTAILIEKGRLRYTLDNLLTYQESNLFKTKREAKKECKRLNKEARK